MALVRVAHDINQLGSVSGFDKASPNLCSGLAHPLPPSPKSDPMNFRPRLRVAPSSADSNALKWKGLVKTRTFDLIPRADGIAIGIGCFCTYGNLSRKLHLMKTANQSTGSFAADGARRSDRRDYGTQDCIPGAKEELVRRVTRPTTPNFQSVIA